jgi:hypothetical protein
MSLKKLVEETNRAIEEGRASSDYQKHRGKNKAFGPAGERTQMARKDREKKMSTDDSKKKLQAQSMGLTVGQYSHFLKIKDSLEKEGKSPKEILDIVKGK